MKTTLRQIALLLLALPCFAQTTPQAKPAAAPELSTDAVNVFFTVRSSSGTLLSNLPQGSFEVREDGRPQAIRSFSAKSARPLTLGLLLETSGYMQNALLAEKEVAGDFLSMVGDQDLAFVMAFDINVDLLQGLTSDHRLLRRAVDKTMINAGGRVSRAQGKEIAPVLHDAVYLAADEILSKQPGRKVLVVFTSGLDHGSKTRLQAAIEAAQRADTMCYVVLFHGSARTVEIKELAEQTGGRFLNAFNPQELTDAVARVATEVRNLYSLTYIPDNPAAGPGFRRIEIVSREGHKVQARKGYYPR